MNDTETVTKKLLENEDDVVFKIIGRYWTREEARTRDGVDLQTLLTADKVNVGPGCGWAPGMKPQVLMSFKTHDGYEFEPGEENE